MMKKILLTLLAIIVLTCGLCSCKKEEGQDTEAETTEDMTESETEIQGNEFARDNVAYYNAEWKR